jgi:hypothetical protein
MTSGRLKSGVIKEIMQRQVLRKYIRQTPYENCKMFEGLERIRRGTWFYPMWKKARDDL